jgi:polyisoprenyl-phosphate glycosyltransferase
MSADNTPIISIAIPCHNEEGNIPVLYQRLKETLARYDAQGTEIILVDDGSTDQTWQLISELCQKDMRVVGIRLSRNFGHQTALTCAISHSKGARLLIMDADLQDPPELLHDMMQQMDAGYEVVYGHRKARQGETLFKRLSAWGYYRVLNHFSEVPIPKDVGDFRLISRRALDALLQMPERVRFTRGMVSWLGFRQTAIDYTREARHSGKTNYSLYSMICFATEGLTSFYPYPLRHAIWLGSIMGMASSALVAYALLAWVATGESYLVSALIGAFLMFQSIQWVMLGLIGSYLGVIIRETKQRPLFLIDTAINLK